MMEWACTIPSFLPLPFRVKMREGEAQWDPGLLK